MAGITSDNLLTRIFPALEAATDNPDIQNTILLLLFGIAREARRLGLTIPDGFFTFKCVLRTSNHIQLAFGPYASNVCLIPSRIYSLSSHAFCYDLPVDGQTLNAIGQSIFELYVCARLRGEKPMPCCNSMMDGYEEDMIFRRSCQCRNLQIPCERNDGKTDFIRSWSKPIHGWTLTCQKCDNIICLPMPCHGDVFLDK